MARDNISSLPEAQQQTRPLGAPSVNVSFRGVFGEKLGDAMERGGQQLASAGLDRESKEIQRFDEARKNDLQDKLGKWEFTNVYDETNPKAARARKGENYTPEVTDKTMEAWDKYAEELASTAANERQANQFADVIRRRRFALQASLGEHEAKQHAAVDKSKFESALSTSIQDGGNNYANDKLRQQALESGDIALRFRAGSEGWDKDRIKSETLNFHTRFHKVIVEKMNETDPVRAQRYLEVNAGDIDQEHLATLRRMTDSDVLMAKGRNIASDIQGKQGITEYGKQETELQRRLDAGEINIREYRTARDWLEKDRTVNERNADLKDEKSTDDMLTEVRKRAMNKTGVLLSENEDGFTKLSSKGQGKVRALVMELMNKGKSDAAAGNAARKEANRNSKEHFRNRPLAERAALGKGTPEEVQKRVDKEYLGEADEPTRQIIAAMARDAYETQTRGQQIDEQEFKRQVAAEADRMFPTDTATRKEFIDKATIWMGKWRRENNYEKWPRQEDLNEMFGRAFLEGDSGYWGFGSNKYGFQVEDGADWTPFAPEDQPYQNNKIVLPKIEKGKSPMNIRKGPANPIIVRSGYTAVTNGKTTLQVSNETVDAWVQKNSPAGWRKVEE